MERRQLAALLAVELRRQRRVTARLLLSTAVIAGVFWLAGKRGPDTGFAIALGMGFGAALIVPVGVTKDRLEGTLAFLTGLPTRPSTIAAARFAAVAVTTLPWAVVAAGGLAWVAAAFQEAPPPGWVALGALPLAWVAFTTVGWILTGVFSRWDLAQLLGVPIVVAVIALLVLPRLAGPLLPADPAAWFDTFFASPWGPLAMAGAALLVAAAGGGAAFGLAVHGIGMYRPDPASF
jgi:hypothetical protein